MKTSGPAGASRMTMTVAAGRMGTSADMREHYHGAPFANLRGDGRSPRQQPDDCVALARPCGGADLHPEQVGVQARSRGGVEPRRPDRVVPRAWRDPPKN